MIKLLLLVMVLAMAMVMVMGIKYLTAGQTPSPSSDDGNEWMKEGTLVSLIFPVIIFI